MPHRPSRPQPSPSPSRGRRGAATRLVLASAVAAAALVLATAASVRSLPTAAEVEPLADSELEVALYRAGLRPEALAAAGLDGGAVSALVGRARAELEDSVDQLRAADAALGAARAEHERFVRLVQSGLATQQQVSDLGAARTALASAEAALATRLDALRAAALGEAVTGGPAAALSAIRGNAPWELPTQYLVRSATEAEWVALREALSAERIAAEAGGEPHPDHAAVLAAWRADTGVAAAAANLGSLRAPAETAWRGAIDSD